MKKIFYIVLILLVLTACKPIEEDLSGAWITDDNGVLILNTDGTFESYHLDLVSNTYFDYDYGTWTSDLGITLIGRSPYYSDDINFEYYGGEELTIGDTHFKRTDINSEIIEEYKKKASMFEFLKNNSEIPVPVSVEKFTGLNKVGLITDQDEIQYQKYQSTENGAEEKILNDDEKYKVSILGEYLYVLNKDTEMEMCLVKRSYFESNIQRKFYMGDNLYIVFTDVSALHSGENYEFNGNSYEYYGDYAGILLISPDNVLDFERTVFSEDDSHICVLSKSDTEHVIYNMETTNLNVDVIEANEIDDLINPIVTNNGILIFACDLYPGKICCKFPDNDSYYILNESGNQINVDNENGELFVETDIGIKKLSESGTELVFPFTGFDSDPELYYGTETAKNIDTIRAAGKNNNIYKEINLKEY